MQYVTSWRNGYSGGKCSVSGDCGNQRLLNQGKDRNILEVAQSSNSSKIQTMQWMWHKGKLFSSKWTEN